MMSSRSMDVRSRGDDLSLAMGVAFSTVVPLRETSSVEEKDENVWAQTTATSVGSRKSPWRSPSKRGTGL